MPLHLLKLSVGSEGIESFDRWIKDVKAGRDTMDHTTRAYPKRHAEILPGGSLYWIIKGAILLRTPIEKFEAVRGDDGIERCRIVFKPKYVIVRPTPRRAFQGWRYLDAADVPPDMPKSSGVADMPSKMRKDLAELGLL
jgi:hypothetical protein